MSKSDESIELSVVLPSYKEGENLRVLLPELKRVLAELAVSSEIIVVDTESPMDDTASVCAAEGVVYAGRHGGNAYGAAVKTGIARSRGLWTIFMDADGSHPPAFIAKLWDLRSTYDLVIASRYVAGGSTDNPRALVFMSRIVNSLYSLVLGMPIKDVSNSLKLYRTEQLKALDLRCQNLDIIEEILYKLITAHKGFAVKEIPFSFRKRMYGSSKRSLLLFILSYFKTLVRLRLGLLG